VQNLNFVPKGSIDGMGKEKKRKNKFSPTKRADERHLDAGWVL
jgi:hypothetical protein